MKGLGTTDGLHPADSFCTENTDTDSSCSAHLELHVDPSCKTRLDSASTTGLNSTPIWKTGLDSTGLHVDEVALESSATGLADDKPSTGLDKPVESTACTFGFTGMAGFLLSTAGLGTGLLGQASDG